VPIETSHDKLSSHRGFTLIELIMAIIILGFVSMMMIPFVTSITRSPDPVIRQRAISLGQAMMDEITAKKWDNASPTGGGPICTNESPGPLARPSLIDNCITMVTPVANLGPETGAPDNENATADDRSLWDDVDDYDGSSEPIGGLFYDQDGNSFSLPGYSRSVTVTYIASDSDPVTASSATALVETDTKRIVVTVVSPRQETMEFVAMACNY